MQRPHRIPRSWQNLRIPSWLVSSAGYFSDGDSPELLPRQQLPPTAAAASQETSCDVSSFQLYVGSETQRCSQRVTGLFTVHLLGLEEMKSGRWEHSDNEPAVAGTNRKWHDLN